jgi:hypothetical protein
MNIAEASIDGRQWTMIFVVIPSHATFYRLKPASDTGR